MIARKATPAGLARLRCAAALALGIAFCPTPGLSAGGRAAADDARGTLVATHDWDDDWGDAWTDYNRTLLQMQRESISSQEEQAREAGRAARRQEIEQSREKSAAEREAYFDSVIEASQASLRAPRGVYYRKPGYSSPDPPGELAQTVEVAGMRYIYEQGVFWLQQGAEYLVVTAPVGAVVRAVPRGAVPAPGGGKALWYYFGTFFAGADGGFAVVKPPAGVSVYYLPDGYSREKVGGADVYRFGDTFFKPVFIQGVLAYQVVSG